MRSVLVTGGSRGLGLGIARKLTKASYRVIALARKETDQLTSAMRETEAEGLGSLQFVPFDLAEIEAIGDLVKKLRTDFGPMFGLVNNAGVSFDGVLAMMPNANIERLIRVNTVAPIVLTKYMVRSMMADGAGRIVSIASITAFTGYSGLSVYSATKASIIGFTKSLAREVGPVGVNVNAVAPGFVDTDMTGSMTDDRRQKIKRRSALRRLSDVGDVADAVEFLLSDKAKNITGTVMTVDAGNTA
jgi:3-oxoacyl-[acyl-carrier protein] reductase